MVRLIGMGPGSSRYVTADAIQKIAEADRVIAFGRIGETAREIRSDVEIVGRVEEVEGLLGAGGDVAILASGDPCFFGLLEYLQRKNVRLDEVVPGLSSVQYLMTRLQKSWQHAVFESFHGRDINLEKVRANKTTVVLTDSKHTPSYISRFLYEEGIRGSLVAGFELSYPQEVIIRADIGGEIEDISPLAVVVIENEMA